MANLFRPVGVLGLVESGLFPAKILSPSDELSRDGLMENKGRASVSRDDLGYLVQAADDYTGAQIEELANTLYMLALSSDNGPAGGKGYASDTVTINHWVIDAALDDFKIERKCRVGFHVA